MFPTFVADPNDPNRRPVIELGEDWPANLRTSFYLACSASVVMLVVGMVLLSKGFPGDPADPALEEVRRFYMTNMRITALGNMVLALGLTSVASYFRRGSRLARNIAAGLAALAIFLNVAAVLFRVTALALSMLIVVLLAFSLLFLFRRDSNAYIERESPKF
ncbi:hypothetical protein [Corynebacterium aquatimens]|uniref:Membrane protein n=1 Tax=Corynebacterium aquatimens TaxID=1190508 RepID=A0A931E1D3_9CORY|nr:hypothetical protein [Corynebacterium aquatimens]MBG6122453.1 putative membrane protein [Corynebacterium aquatimens]